MKNILLAGCAVLSSITVFSGNEKRKMAEDNMKAFYAPVFSDRPWHVGVVYNSYFLNKNGKQPVIGEKLEQFRPMYSDMFGLRIARAPIDWGMGIQTGVYYHRHHYFHSIEGNFNAITSYAKLVNNYSVDYLNIPLNLLFGPNDGDVYIYFKIGASMDYFMGARHDGYFWNPLTQFEYDVYTKTEENNDFEEMRWNVNCGFGLSAHFGSDSQFGFILEPNFFKSVTTDSKVYYSEYKPLMIGITTGFQYNFRSRRSGNTVITDF
ncbi:MAG: hypothetical protein ACOZCO_04305 [Bacteroidota bacterium]